jgi:hypothetical protein
VVHPPPAQAGLGDGEGLALAAQQALGRHPHVLVVDERVHALVLGLAGQAHVRTMSTPGVSVGTRNIEAPL